MKHFARRAAACALALTLLAGCAQSADPAAPDPKDPISLEVWHYYNGPQKVAFDALVGEFNETVGLERGIIIQAFSQGSVNDLAERVMDAAQKKVGAAEMPDVFATYADSAYELDKMGLLAKLDDYLTKEERASYVDAYLEEGCFGDGSLKVFPTAKSSEVLMVNLTDWEKFSSATGARLEDLATAEGLTRTAQAYYEWTDGLTEAPDDGRALFGRDAMANYMLLGYKELTGQDLYNAASGLPSETLDKTAMRRLWDNFYVPYLNGWFTARGKFRSDDAKTGDIIALVGSTTGAVYFPDTVTISDTESYPVEAAVLPAPSFEGCTPYLVQQGAGMAVHRTDPATEAAAMTFLKWFTEPERNIAFAIGSGYLPVQKQANDMDLIRAALDAQEDTPARPRLEQVLETAIGAVNRNQLYVSKPGDGTVEARNLLEYSMSELAQRDRAAVEEAIAAGTPREEALVPYLADERFEDWFGGLATALDNALN